VKQINKILIIRLSSFGDIILTFPLINHLKELNPSSEIDFITKKEYAQLIKSFRKVDNLLCYGDKSIAKLRKIIRQNKYDLIIDLHNNFRSFFIKAFNKTKYITYKKGNIKKFLLIYFKLNLFNEIIPVYKKYILPYKKYNERINLNFVTSNLESENIEDKDYILLCPTSKHFTKTYPKEKFSEIVKNNSAQTFYLISGDTENEKMICKYIENGNSNVINLSGKTDYKQLISFIKNAKMVICNDSGILHLSESLGKRVVAFFGSTVKEFGFYPQLSTSIVIENKNLKCRPCSRAGKDYCPKGHFKCMNDLTIKLDEYLP